MLKKIGYFFGTIFVVLILMLIALGFGIEQGYVPDASALPRGKIHPRYIKNLRESGIIEQDEEVFFLYSTAFYSVISEGNLFTDTRVISYQDLDGTLEIFDALYAEIESMDFDQSDSWDIDSTITINKTDGDWFVLWVENGEGIDKTFYEKLNRQWELVRGPGGEPDQ